MSEGYKNIRLKSKTRDRLKSYKIIYGKKSVSAMIDFALDIMYVKL